MPNPLAEPSARRSLSAIEGMEHRLANRNILLLQGLMGPLFRRVGQALRRDGYGVHKVNFNGGDRLFWRLPNGIDYIGSAEAWPEALERLIREREITDVVLFGDCRPMHMSAIALCRNLQIQVHVFEEGYIRPGWVTLELGGVNAHSSLPRDPDWYRAEAAKLPATPEHYPAPSSFRRRAIEAIAYNLADVLTRRHYAHWENHRPWHPLVEGMGWARRLSRRKSAALRSEDLLARLEASADRYMIFPLQLDSDAQIRLHSSFAGVADALQMVITSFAAHAPAPMRLVVKEHPLDNGVRDWRGETAALAALHGISDRVDFLESGDIAPVARRAEGLVTINSTSGTLALAFDVPVIVLGRAIYDIDGITFQGKLDDFWSNPGRPDSATFAAFCRVLIERCLVPGGFFSEEGLARVTEGVITRLEKAIPLTQSTKVRGSTSPSWRDAAVGKRTGRATPLG